MRKEKGFSMLETIVVSGIVLVASAATIPSIVNASKQYQLKSVTQQINQALLTAKYDAIRQNKSMSVSFDVANNKLTTSDGKIINLPAGVTFSGPDVSSAPGMIVNGASAQLATQESNNKMACSFPVDSVNANIRKATFTSRGVPKVEPGELNWVYLKNANGEMAAVTLSSAGSTSSFSKMSNSGWKGSSSTGCSYDDNDSTNNSRSGSSNSGSGSSGSGRSGSSNSGSGSSGSDN
jgi:type II secretory pathway pseudopilin PulG